MRAPPPLSNNAIVAHGATAILGLLALGATLGWWMHYDVTWLFQDIRAFRGQPWRFLTCVLLHVNPMHLAFNLYWL